MIRAALLATLLAGCAAVDPPVYCIGGFLHSYASASGYRQVWSEMWKGVPCEEQQK